MRAFITILSVCLITTPAAAQQWTLTTAAFEREQVELRSVDERGVGVARGDRQRIFDFNSFLQIERPSAEVESAGPFVLHLADGDRVAGEPLFIHEEQVHWNNPLAGELAVPLHKVKVLARPDRTPREIDGPLIEDIVTLTNGDTVSGIVLDLSETEITIEADTGLLPVPADSVASVHFAAAGEVERPAAPERAFRLRLSDGSRLTVQSVELSDQRLQLTPPDQEPRDVALSQVIGIEQVNGPVSWLSSRQPVEIEQIPFFEMAWPTMMDRSVTGEPIRFGERAYSRGIGVHAYSRLVYELDGSYQTFRTRYAIDGEWPYANVTVRVKLDDRIVHEQEDVESGRLSPVLEVDLDGAQRLTLEVDYGKNLDVQARFNWIEPALVRK